MGFAHVAALRDGGLRIEADVALRAWFFVAAPLARFGRTCWWGAVLVELKAVRAIDPSHIAQLLNYLRCTVLETGLILNFGPPMIRRLIFANERKHPHLHHPT